MPVVVHGADRLWRRGLTVRPGGVRVELLPPIATTGWAPARLDDHIADIHSLFVDTLSPRQRPLVAHEEAP